MLKILEKSPEAVRAAKAQEVKSEQDNAILNETLKKATAQLKGEGVNAEVVPIFVSAFSNKLNPRVTVKVAKEHAERTQQALEESFGIAGLKGWKMTPSSNGVLLRKIGSALAAECAERLGCKAATDISIKSYNGQLLEYEFDTSNSLGHGDMGMWIEEFKTHQAYLENQIREDEDLSANLRGHRWSLEHHPQWAGVVTLRILEPTS